MKRICSLLCIACLLIISGCSYANHVKPNGQLSYYGSEDSLGAESIKSKTDTSLTFSKRYGLQSGELTFTLTNPRLITNKNGLPSTTAKNDGFGIEVFYFSKKPTAHYPDFIAEDGSFPEGTYILLIDITVESQDARAYTTADLNELGNPIGLITDPYIFNADDIVRVGAAVNTDSRQAADELDIGYRSPSYYSELGSQEERSYAYRLEPEQTITFTLGFGLSDKNTGGIFDLNYMFLSCTSDEDGMLCQLVVDSDGHVKFG